MLRPNPARDITPAFVGQVADWIAADGEVLVVLRWIGGGRDYSLCRSRAEFERIIAFAGVGTDIIAMRGHHLPVRRRGTEELIARAKAAVPDGAEYLAVAMLPEPTSTWLSRSANGESHGELEEDLRSWMREGVAADIAVGVMPVYWIADHAGMVSRAKGGVDGPR